MLACVKTKLHARGGSYVHTDRRQSGCTFTKSCNLHATTHPLQTCVQLHIPDKNSIYHSNDFTIENYNYHIDSIVQMTVEFRSQ